MARTDNASGRMHPTELAAVRQRKREKAKPARRIDLADQIEALLAKSPPLDALPEPWADDPNLSPERIWLAASHARGRRYQDLLDTLRPMLTGLIEERNLYRNRYRALAAKGPGPKANPPDHGSAIEQGPMQPPKGPA